MNAAVVTFVLYLLGVVAIGAWASRFSSAGVSEFFLGGRRMNRVVVALSAVVSGRSAWLLTGVTGMAYTRGASAVWAVVGYVVVELFLFLYYAPRLRRAADAYDAVTVPDFFAGRFTPQSTWLDNALGKESLAAADLIVGFEFGTKPASPFAQDPAPVYYPAPSYPQPYPQGAPTGYPAQYPYPAPYPAPQHPAPYYPAAPHPPQAPGR